MSAIDYEVEYNNRARVPEHPEIFARWAKEAAAFRASHPNADLAVSYGASPRQFIDFFWPSAERNAPLVLFIHGGYWRSLDPSGFSHIAAGANAHGLAFALAGYDLCPAVTVETIVDQMRAATAFLYRRHKKRMLVSGHSAGGHLAACILATDWKKYGADLPADLVTAGLSISGLFDLAPLMQTGINADLRLDAASAARVSPLFWSVPAGRTLDAWVGGAESNEFLRQSQAIEEAWGRQGATTEYVAVPDANHFTVLDPLADARSDLTQRLVHLARALPSSNE
jgi:arylformamidase